MLGRVNDAIESYKKLIARKPNSATVLSNLISVSLSRNDNNAVREYSEKLFRLQPQSRSALQGQAILALANGRYEEAAQRCSELVKIMPSSFEAHYNLGVAYHKARKTDLAIKAYNESLRVQPIPRKRLSTSE